MLHIMFNTATLDLQGNEAPDHTNRSTTMAKQERKRTPQSKAQTIARRQARSVRYAAATRTTHAGRAR